MNYSLRSTLAVCLILGGGMLVAAGCSKQSEMAQAMKNAEEATKAVAAAGQQAQEHKATGPAVPSATLVTFLPTISGYTAEKEPEKVDMNMNGQSWTSVDQTYKSGDKQVKVSMFDYNYNVGLAAAYNMMLNMNIETNDEIQKTEKFGNFPGWLNWKKNNSEGTIGIVVNDRIFVIVEGHSGVTLDELRSIANGLNLGGIAKASS